MTLHAYDNSWSGENSTKYLKHFAQCEFKPRHYVSRRPELPYTNKNTGLTKSAREILKLTAL